MAPKPRIEAPNDDENRWIEGNRELARMLANAYVSADLDLLPSLAQLDATSERWAKDTAPDRADPNSVAHALGVALGRHLMDALGLRWVIATDEYGSELGVYRDRKNVLILPVNATAKRYVRGEFRFFEDFAARTAQEIASLESRK